MTTEPGSLAVSWPRASALAARVAVIAAYFVAWAVVYTFTNVRGSDPAVVIHLVRPCDLVPGIIQPWTAILYLAGGFVLPLLPFYYNGDWPKLWFVLACYTIASVLAFFCYWVWPVGIVRPPFEGPGLGRWLMRWVVEVDGEANCFPSSHVFFAVLGAMLVSHGGAHRPVQIVVWALAAAVCATTVTTGQHYFLDVAGGVAVALVGYGAARLIWSVWGTRPVM
jgi:membrane-associated phospholipid phosphatase